jgi:DNA invertase Pin-like site-specific DNA recombinase
VIITLDRMGRSPINMIGLCDELRRGVNVRDLNLDGGNVGTGTPMDSMVFTAMAALAQIELAIRRAGTDQRQHDETACRRQGPGPPMATVQAQPDPERPPPGRRRRTGHTSSQRPGNVARHPVPAYP